MLSELVVCIGWSFLIIMGLIVLWCFVRYVLPFVLMLGAVGFLCWAGFQVYAAHTMLMPQVRPAVKKLATPPTNMVEFCAHHPNARVCEDRD